jgi:mutator protein MutT
MKIATLAVIVQDEKVLLGYKKKGEIGTGTLNGPGGKVEEGETPVQCVIRETQEEVGITLTEKHLAHLGTITFFAGGTPDFKVLIFYTTVFSGEPQETKDMIPGWYPIDNLPFDKMLESDREWFAKIAKGERCSARVYYRERAKVFERIEFI